MNDQAPLFHGVISGQRRRDHAEIAGRVDRIAGGLQRLGVGQGDSVCILMRNDIAFIEAAYAAMRLGAYAVPVNWHFKPEEISWPSSPTMASTRATPRPTLCCASVVVLGDPGGGKSTLCQF